MSLSSSGTDDFTVFCCLNQEERKIENEKIEEKILMAEEEIKQL